MMKKMIAIPAVENSVIMKEYRKQKEHLRNPSMFDTQINENNWISVPKEVEKRRMKKNEKKDEEYRKNPDKFLKEDVGLRTV